MEYYRKCVGRLRVVGCMLTLCKHIVYGRKVQQDKSTMVYSDAEPFIVSYYFIMSHNINH